jgi:hypothetical protein
VFQPDAVIGHILPITRELDATRWRTGRWFCGASAVT